MELLRRARRRLRAPRAWLLLLLFGPAATAADGKKFDEYDVKAAFILNFAKFVEWPDETDAERVVVCIVGDDPFGSTLERLSRASGSGLRFELRRLDEPIEAISCHIAFARSAERAKVAKLLENVGTAPVLTVGEDRDFAERGGVVSLPVENERVRITINTEAAERAGLEISAKLLVLAELLPQTTKD